jgi:hypothetical protein
MSVAVPEGEAFWVEELWLEFFDITFGKASAVAEKGRRWISMNTLNVQVHAAHSSISFMFFLERAICWPGD